MQPYPENNLTEEKAVYNYRLSRTRRISENVFGILQHKFSIYTKMLQGTPGNITIIIMATCVLYNFLRKNKGFAHTEQEDQQNIDERSTMSSNLQRLRRV